MRQTIKTILLLLFASTLFANNGTGNGLVIKLLPKTSFAELTPFKEFKEAKQVQINLPLLELSFGLDARAGLVGGGLNLNLNIPNTPTHFALSYAYGQGSIGGHVIQAKTGFDFLNLAYYSPETKSSNLEHRSIKAGQSVIIQPTMIFGFQTQVLFHQDGFNVWRLGPYAQHDLNIRFRNANGLSPFSIKIFGGIDFFVASGLASPVKNISDANQSAKLPDAVGYIGQFYCGAQVAFRLEGNGNGKAAFKKLLKE